MYRHLAPDQQRFPQIGIVNLPRWEVGHVGWFQEFWCRRYAPDDPRGARTPSRLAQADAWWDSARVAYPTRWQLALPGWDGIDAYLAATLDDTLRALARSRDRERYFFELSLLHEHMHGEALLMTLQTLELPLPPGLNWAVRSVPPGGDVDVPGGTMEKGAARGDEVNRFVFDNEKWGFEVTVAPFAIARRCVTSEEFAAFVEDAGYTRRDLWSAEGWRWREARNASHPAYWRRNHGAWRERRFDRWSALDGGAPVRHVGAHEAEAYCAWAGRRLPTEDEWECAAGSLVTGGLWEWTATPFLPYPGFAPDPYAEYSEPWFGDHRVLRGSSFATAPRLAHRRFRNFYKPERVDMFVGFRTCARA